MASAIQTITRLAVAGFRPLNVWSGQGRHNELDGLRGWAALSVVLFHQLKWEFGKFIPFFDNPIASFIFDGRFAVCVFFILSGEALSSSYFNLRQDRSIASLAIKRYIRLTMPIFFIYIICFFIAKFHLVPGVEISKILGEQNPATEFLTKSVDWKFYLKSSLIDVYMDNKDINMIDTYLWTMHYEIVGSFAIFFFLFMFKSVTKPWLLAITLTFLSIFAGISGNYICFACGCFFSWLRSRGFFSEMHALPAWRSLTLVAIIATVDGLANWKGVMWERKAFVAIPFVFVLWTSLPSITFLKNWPSKILGVLSFPVYLTQFPVVISFTSILVVAVTRQSPMTTQVAIVVGIISVLTSYLTAALFVPVEVFTKWVGDQTVRLLVVDSKK